MDFVANNIGWTLIVGATLVTGVIVLLDLVRGARAADEDADDDTIRYLPVRDGQIVTDVLEQRDEEVQR